MRRRVDNMQELPHGWRAKESSRKAGTYYYINTVTNETQWEFPTEPASAPSSSSSSTGSSNKARASHLLVKHRGSRRPSSWREENITRSKEDARQILQGYLDTIQSSGDIPTKFAELASQFSDCSSAKRGGDLGVWERGQMQKSFDDAAFDLQIGELSGIVDSDSGLHIILRTG